MSISVNVVKEDSRISDLENKAKRKSMIENGLAKKGKDRKWLSGKTGISLFNLNAYIDGLTNLDDRQTKKIVEAIGIENFMQEAMKESHMPHTARIHSVSSEGLKKIGNEDTNVKREQKTEEKKEEKAVVVNGPAQRYQNVGEMIKFYAMKKHLTSAEASRKIGCRQADFEEWENGISLPDQQTFINVLRTLQIKEMQYGALEKASREEQQKMENDGAELRKLRVKKGLSINDLADKIHGTRFEIQCYENGYVEPDSETLDEIRKTLNSLPDVNAGLRKTAMTKKPTTPQEARMAKTFGTRLKAEREKQGLKAQDVFLKTSLKGKYGWSYKQVEYGNLLPTKLLADELVDILGCTAKSLYGNIAGFPEYIMSTEVKKEDMKTSEIKKPESVEPVKAEHDSEPETSDQKTPETKNGTEDELEVIAAKFGMTKEEFLAGLNGMNFSIKDEATGKTWTMAPTVEELTDKLNALSREGRIKAGKAIDEILNDPANKAS